MGAKRIIIFLLIMLLLSIFSIYYPSINKLTTHAIKEEIKENYPKEQAILEIVIDGDTIEAKTGNETWKIRLLGINTPEKKMPFSNESSNFLKQFENKTIVLERDFEDTDKYDRKLRYIFYQDENVNGKGFKRFINLEILENGFANSYYTDSLKYEKELLRAEAQAKNFEKGIWSKSQEVCSQENCIRLVELNCTGEFFVIKNTCSFNCDMNGWFVKDAGRNTFYLSSLLAEEEKTYFSKNKKEVWNNDHDKFFIFDENGFLVLFYEY
jgi:micrococcal nuclease